MNGTLLVAVGEGLAIGVAYFVAGVPNALMFLIFTTAFALIPFGAWLAFTAAAIVTISGGGSGIAAAGVFLWGSIVMLAGDHFIWPSLVSGSARLPFLLTFAGIFGGLAAFGLIGLFCRAGHHGSASGDVARVDLSTHPTDLNARKSMAGPKLTSAGTVMVHRLLDWFFRNRETGEITIAQSPNPALWIAIVAGIMLWVWPSAGKLSLVLTAIFKGGLLVWAADEIARGVNPWRRCLGAGVALYELTTFL